MGGVIRYANSKERSGEKIGAGFVIFRRHRKSKRIAPNPNGYPFEHPDLDSATQEMLKLSAANPGKQYCIFQEISWARHDKPAGPEAQP